MYSIVFLNFFYYYILIARYNTYFALISKTQHSVQYIQLKLIKFSFIYMTPNHNNSYLVALYIVRQQTYNKRKKTTTTKRPP